MHDFLKVISKFNVNNFLTFYYHLEFSAPQFCHLQTEPAPIAQARC